MMAFRIGKIATLRCTLQIANLNKVCEGVQFAIVIKNMIIFKIFFIVFNYNLWVNSIRTISYYCTLYFLQQKNSIILLYFYTTRRLFNVLTALSLELGYYIT